MLELIIVVIGAFILSFSKVKGFLGETSVRMLLLRLDTENYKVLNDILLRRKSGRTTQIDHIVVSRYGVFVIETKNYSGWIFGKEGDKYWMQTLNKRTKNKFFNPIFQNKGHINALKEIVGYDIPFYSIVVFSSKATLKNKINGVVYTPQLIRAIKKYDKVVVSKDVVNRICSEIMRQNIEDKMVKKEHVRSVRRKMG